MRVVAQPFTRQRQKHQTDGLVYDAGEGQMGEPKSSFLSELGKFIAHLGQVVKFRRCLGSGGDYGLLLRLPRYPFAAAGNESPICPSAHRQAGGMVNEFAHKCLGLPKLCGHHCNQVILTEF